MRRRGFTLLELLIVIAIIATLVGLLGPALWRAMVQTRVAAARAGIETIKIALASYLADHRGYPRNSAYATNDDLLRDDAAALYAALQNHASLELGGGAQAPYLEGWKEVGLVEDLSKLEADSMGKDGLTGVERLDADQLALSQTVPWQQQHGPRSGAPLVLLDPWGNPYHYREWAGVRDQTKQALVLAPVPRTGFSRPPNGTDAPVTGPVLDRPHTLMSVDIWSNGPNGINEYGAGDDVSSWGS